MTDHEFKYWAFLCYSHLDNTETRLDAPGASGLCWGNWLHEALKTFSVPSDFAGHPNARGEVVPDRIDPVFQDTEERPEEASLSAGIQAALAQSRCLIVICSPRSAQSLHVNEAVRYFKHLGRGNRILPLVVAGEPNAGDGGKPGVSPDQECFVPALRHPLNADGSIDVNSRDRGPIFADARQGAEKKEVQAHNLHDADTELEIAKIQLIAGLIGVGFNGLLRREQKRRFAEAGKPVQMAQNPDTATAPQAEEMQRQIQEFQSQVQSARSQAVEAQNQVLVFQNQTREVLSRLEETRRRAQAAEDKVQEFERQIRAMQSQLEQARNQIRDAQQKILEAQNLPQDARSQIQEAQNKWLEAQNQAREAQHRTQEIESQIRQAERQAEAAQAQAREAQNRVLATQAQTHETQKQLEAARSQAVADEHHIKELEDLIRQSQKQLEESRQRQLGAEGKVLQVQDQVREAQSKTESVQSQAGQVEAKARMAKRLIQVFAVMAVLAVLAAGTTAQFALRQRLLAKQATAKAAAAATGQFDLAQGGLNPDQVRETLQKFGGLTQVENRQRSLDDLAKQIPTGQIADTLNASFAILDDTQQQHFQAQLLDRWMQTNWTATFDWACQLTNVDFRQRVLGIIVPDLPAGQFTNALAGLNKLDPAPAATTYSLLFQHWTTNDPVQAIDQLQTIPDREVGSAMLGTVMTAWMKQAPEAAVTWAKSQPDSEIRAAVLERCVAALAKTDFSKALTVAASLAEGTSRDTAMAGLFADWAAKDLAAAAAACQQLPAGAARDMAQENILNEQIDANPVSAAAIITNLPPGDYRQEVISELCENWAATNAPAALAWAQSLASRTERDAAVDQVVGIWARQNPEAAMQFARQHPELSSATLGEITVALFAHDLTATTNWIASLPAGDKKEAAQLALVEPWAQNDPQGLAAYALTLPAGDVQTHCLTAACEQISTNDFSETVALLQPLNDAHLRQTLLTQAAGNGDLLHADEAAKDIAAMPSGDDQKAAIQGLLSTWATANPESTLNWLRSFSETNSQAQHLQMVLKSWAQTEPAAAAKWLANLPAGAADNDLTNAFLAGAAQKYPEFAAQWTQTVTDESQRQTLQVQVARMWLKTDETAATNWIKGLNLPEPAKESLERPQP